MLRTRILGLAAFALMALAPASQAAVIRYRTGFYGGFGPAWGYGYGGYYGGPAMVYNAHPNAGQVKFETKQKEAQVFIDGGFAGTVKELKSPWLRTGNHDIEIRGIADGQDYTRRVFVPAGKTVHLRPEF